MDSIDSSCDVSVFDLINGYINNPNSTDFIIDNLRNRSYLLTFATDYFGSEISLLNVIISSGKRDYYNFSNTEPDYSLLYKIFMECDIWYDNIRYRIDLDSKKFERLYEFINFTAENWADAIYNNSVLLGYLIKYRKCPILQDEEGGIEMVDAFTLFLDYHKYDLGRDSQDSIFNDTKTLLNILEYISRWEEIDGKFVYNSDILRNKNRILEILNKNKEILIRTIIRYKFYTFMSEICKLGFVPNIIDFIKPFNSDIPEIIRLTFPYHLKLTKDLEKNEHVEGWKIIYVNKFRSRLLWVLTKWRRFVIRRRRERVFLELIYRPGLGTEYEKSRESFNKKL